MTGPRDRTDLRPALEVISLLVGTAARRDQTRDRALRLLLDADAERLADELARRRLLPLLGTRALETLGSAAPAELRGRVHAAVTVARARGLAIEAETCRLVALLGDGGILAVPLKGPLLADAAHGDLGLRETDDVDLLVPAGDLSRAVRLLVAEGYDEPDDPIRLNGLPDLHFALGRGRGPSAELHWRVHWYEEAFSRDMLARAAPGADGLPRLHPHDLAASLLLFYARDGFHGVRLAADVAALWERNPEALPPGCLGRYATAYPELAPALGAACRVTERLTGAPATGWLGGGTSPSRRSAAAARLASWTQAGDRDQLAANISLVDGLLSPRGRIPEFIRRELVPREGPPVAHAGKMLARYAAALWAVRGDREWAPVQEPRRRRVELFGMGLDPVTEAEAISHVFTTLAAGRGGWLVTPNLDQLRQFRGSAETRELLRDVDLAVADGMPLTWAARIAGTPLPARVAGSDLIWSLSAEAARHDRSIFLLGGAPGASDGALAVLRRQYPGIRIAGTHTPAFGFESDPAAVEAIRAELRAARPDIVYVALGFPKQERLIRELRGELPGAWFVGVGISFSFLAGDVARAPDWLQRVGLEWAHRLAMEPRRLARRYLLEGLPFAARLALHAGARRLLGRASRAGPSPVVTGTRVVFTHGAHERRRAQEVAQLLAEDG